MSIWQGQRLPQYAVSKRARAATVAHHDVCGVDRSRAPTITRLLGQQSRDVHEQTIIS